jgi:hypothetical protein
MMVRMRSVQPIEHQWGHFRGHQASLVFAQPYPAVVVA